MKILHRSFAQNAVSDSEEELKANEKQPQDLAEPKFKRAIVLAIFEGYNYWKEKEWSNVVNSAKRII